MRQFARGRNTKKKNELAHGVRGHLAADCRPAGGCGWSRAPLAVGMWRSVPPPQGLHEHTTTSPHTHAHAQAAVKQDQAAKQSQQQLALEQKEQQLALPPPPGHEHAGSRKQQQGEGGGSSSDEEEEEEMPPDPGACTVSGPGFTVRDVLRGG